MSERFHLAQLNIARAREPLDHPLMADFFARVDEINTLAERSPGFVWRWTDEPPPGTDRRLLINLTVWRSVDALADFTYRSAHAEVFKRRKAWFEASVGPSVALWWVPAGERPCLSDAFDRLARLEREGPSPAAFGFRDRFEPPIGSD